MIFHNEKAYQDSDPIEWEIAIDIVGYYFQRAKYLGLPKPPACFVFDNKFPTQEQHKIIAEYHELYIQAELCDISNDDFFEELPTAKFH